MTKKVCIIGAGLAGLAAAYSLAEARNDVLVLEARDRVGGRTWSQTISNGALIERGAEYVDLTSFTLVQTVARLGLRLAPAGVSFYNREPRGGVKTTREEIFEAIHIVRQILAEHPERLFQESAFDVLKDAPIPSGARDAIVARLQTTNAHPAHDLSAYLLAHVPFSNAEGLHIAEGNQSIALKFAEKLNSRIKLSQKVESIEWSDSEARIHTNQGEKFEADICVITIPASVYSQIQFRPTLPKWKTDAIASVKYSHAAKLHVPLRKIPPATSILIVPDFVWSWTAKGADGNVQPIVGAYAGSMPALEKLKVFDGPRVWYERLKAMRPELEMEDTGIVLSTWSFDPFILGAYSVMTPNTKPDHYENLAKPIGCLHFAGEHTNGSPAGDMNTALESGYRVAKEIVQN
jgi:monoamine oxidase